MNSIRFLLVAAVAAMPLAAGAVEVTPTWYGRGGSVMGQQPQRASAARQGEQRVMHPRGTSLVIYKAKPAQDSALAEQARRSTGG